MRTKIILLFFGIALLNACNTSNEQLLSEFEEVKNKLIEESARKDSVIIAIVDAFNQIEDNLDSIKQRQGIITINTRDISEFRETKREKILRNIQIINALLENNRKRLNTLRNRIKKSGIKIGKLEKMIANLQNNIEEKDIEIRNLKVELANLNFSMDSLSIAYEIKTEELDNAVEESEQKTIELNTAFYCYGSFKELKEQGVLTKEGGFIGIGKIEKLASDFNKKYFTEVDITKVNSIDLNTKKAKLVTTHPVGSFSFETKDDIIKRLVIKDTKEFWSASKYLVITIE